MAYLIALEDMLAGEGYDVDTAETLQSADLMLCNAGKYDYVIADVRLSGTLSTEGLTLLETIKKQMPHTKVIVITGYGNPAVMERAYRGGADFYFEKPVSFETLLRALNGGSNAHGGND